jgi:cephalosporin-C deacetylase-like acetyl esterase
MFAAYNVITAEKHLNIAPIAGHHDFPEQKKVTNAWLFSQLMPPKN